MRLALLLFIAPIILLGGCSSSSGPANLVEADPCLTLAAPRDVEFARPPAWQPAAELPRYCQVQGTIAGRIQFEYRMPEQWNGRFMMAGCGGFCGAVLADKPGHSNTINIALQRGYAAISHDGGHQAANADTSWAFDDPEALEIWAHKVLPLVVAAGTDMASGFYGKPPAYRYFSGCSNGGRLGMMAAQRYPELFDGIAAGASIFDLSGTAGLWGNWMITQLQSAGAPITPAQQALVKDAVMQQCDGKDGANDGIIQQPRQCEFDFTSLQCSGSTAASEQCLAAEQVARLQRLYGGVMTSAGERIYPALEYGSEHYTDLWLYGADGKPGWGVSASQGYRQLLSHDLYNRDAPDAVSTDEMRAWIERSAVPATTDATNPDLSGLQSSGGKLLIYHGWADPLIVPEPTVEYYAKAAANAGGTAALQRNARLFMLPGWGHCWERPAAGPDQFDPLEILEQWVEQGIAPDQIELSLADAVPMQTMPVCAYPRVAKLMPAAGASPVDEYRCTIADD
jgi:feruloyl esterase